MRAMNAKPKSQTQDKFIVRLPDGMREKIAAEAAAAGRSMNAEIVQRLQESFQPKVEISQKRAVYISEVCETAQQVVRYWEMDNRNETEEGMLAEWIDDLDRSLSRLAKLDNGS